MSNSDVVTDAFVLTLDGRSLDATHLAGLLSVTVEQTWSAADRIELTFSDHLHDAPSVTIGATIDVKIGRGSSEEPLFKGEITAIGYRWSYGTRTAVFEGYDARHKLTRNITPTSYENITLKQVAEAVAQRHGLSVRSPHVLTSTTYPSLMVAASDFAVLQHIARLSGCTWSLDDTTIVFEDATARPALVTLTDADLTDFDLRFTPIERTTEVAVHGWDPVNKQAIVGKQAMPTSRHTPTNLDTTTSLKQGPATSWSAGPISAADADVLAMAIGRRLRDAEVTGRGTTRANAKIRPGTMVEVRGVSPRVNGKYLVSAADHVFGDSWGSLTTHFRVGPADAALADLMGERGAPNAATLGVTIGIVTDIERKDQGAQPGTVRVKLPMISDSVQTGWARVMSQGSGADRGMVFLPEVGDEVLVAFEHGDLNRPYVLGTVWNQAGKVFGDTVAGNANQERRIVSKLGNRIRFVDKKEGDATSGLVIEADQAKTKLFFGYKQTLFETTDRPLEIKNGKASIVLDKDEITITANKITIKSATGDLVVDTSNVSVKAKQKFEVTANSQINIKGTGPATIESSAIMTVKGSMVKVN